MDYYKVIVLFLSLFFSTTIKSQTVTYSPYEKFNFNIENYTILGTTGGLLYTYRSTNDGSFLDAYDDSMNKKSTILLDFLPKKFILAHRFHRWLLKFKPFGLCNRYRMADREASLPILILFLVILLVITGSNVVQPIFVG